MSIRSRAWKAWLDYLYFNNSKLKREEDLKGASDLNNYELYIGPHTSLSSGLYITIRWLQMPYLDIRCLASSSLTPTSTVYRNNYNITPSLEVSSFPSFKSPYRILKLQLYIKGQGLLHITCKDFRPYYMVPVIYYS
jgi:hypothetical protein